MEILWCCGSYSRMHAKCMENIKWKAATQYTIRKFFTFNIKFIFYRMRFWFCNCVENIIIKQKELKDVVKEFVFHALKSNMKNIINIGPQTLWTEICFMLLRYGLSLLVCTRTLSLNINCDKKKQCHCLWKVFSWKWSKHDNGLLLTEDI